MTRVLWLCLSAGSTLNSLKSIICGISFSRTRLLVDFGAPSIPEPMPKEWPRKPTVVSIKKKARDAWKIVNKTKLTCLKSKWDAPSTDHYYDRRYGCGTD